MIAGVSEGLVCSFLRDVRRSFAHFLAKIRRNMDLTRRTGVKNKGKRNEIMKKSLLKRVGTILLALSMFAGMTACGGSGSSDSSAASSPAEMVQSSEPASADYSDVNIGVIFPIGGLGDNSAADDAYKGLINAQQKLGFNFDYSEPVTEQDREAMILEYSEAEEYDLIVAISSETLNIVKSIQPDYPDQDKVQ